MQQENAEQVVMLTKANQRLQALVGDLLKKNEGLRQQLALLQQPARATGSPLEAS